MMATEQFISEIQKRRAIWDSSTTDYGDHELKRRSWAELVEIFGGTNLSTLEQRDLGNSLQRKWKNIRSSYTRELQRQKGCKSGNSGQRKSEYIYFKQLSFLRNVVTLKNLKCYAASDVSVGDLADNTTSSADELSFQDVRQTRQRGVKRKSVDEDDDNFGIVLASEQFKNSSCVEKLRQNKSVDEDCDSLSTVSVKEQLRNSNCVEKARQRDLSEDPDRLFLLSLVSTLNSVKQEKKLAVKIQLMSVLNDALHNN